MAGGWACVWQRRDSMREFSGSVRPVLCSDYGTGYRNRHTGWKSELCTHKNIHFTQRKFKHNQNFKNPQRLNVEGFIHTIACPWCQAPYTLHLWAGWKLMGVRVRKPKLDLLLPSGGAQLTDWAILDLSFWSLQTVVLGRTRALGFVCLYLLQAVFSSPAQGTVSIKACRQDSQEHLVINT